MMKSSNIEIWWHMIIRGHLDEVTLAINSLQGLYDGIVIAVDDREDSDEVFYLLNDYPNMIAYRQCFDNFKRYDLARQDALDKVPHSADYIGWSDSDEILMTEPWKIRKWLNETKPDSVNCGIHYVYPVGGHIVGETYRNGRVRIWKYGTRKWSRPCHEYPYPVNGVDDPVIGDIIFNHVKRDNSDYRADHHIVLMQDEIDKGNIGWLYYQAREYQIKGDLDTAIDKYLDYAKLGVSDNFDNSIINASEILLQRQDYKTLVKRLLEIDVEKFDNPILYEYLALGNYYLGNVGKAKDWHIKALTKDPNNEYSSFRNNNQYFGVEE